MARRRKAQSYHHGDLRRALIEATVGILESEGSGAVSLSAAARCVGVSAQATYNHFHNKADLLAAVAERTVRALEQAMRERCDAAADPLEGLQAVGLAYVEFACSRAAEFRLLSAPELSEKSGYGGLLAAYEAAFSVVVKAIEDGQRVGVVRAGPARKLGAAAWSTAHGLAWLMIDGQISISGDDPTRVARDTLAVLFQGLRHSENMSVAR